MIEEGTSEPQKLELKPLPMELKYAYLEEYEQCPVVISSLLNTSQESSLLHILRENKQALGWNITDLKGTSSLHPSHLLRGGGKVNKAATEKTESPYAGSGSGKSPEAAASWYHLPHIR